MSPTPNENTATDATAADAIRESLSYKALCAATSLHGTARVIEMAQDAIASSGAVTIAPLDAMLNLVRSVSDRWSRVEVARAVLYGIARDLTRASAAHAGRAGDALDAILYSPIHGLNIESADRARRGANDAAGALRLAVNAAIDGLEACDVVTHALANASAPDVRSALIIQAAAAWGAAHVRIDENPAPSDVDEVPRATWAWFLGEAGVTGVTDEDCAACRSHARIDVRVRLSNAPAAPAEGAQ